MKKDRCTCKIRDQQQNKVGNRCWLLLINKEGTAAGQQPQHSESCCCQNKDFLNVKSLSLALSFSLSLVDLQTHQHLTGRSNAADSPRPPHTHAHTHTHTHTNERHYITLHYMSFSRRFYPKRLTISAFQPRVQTKPSDPLFPRHSRIR